MKKLILKLAKKFIPSAQQLAQLAAEEVAKRANAVLLPRKETATKWLELAGRVTSAANKLAEMSRDGNIDAAETKDLALMLTPAFEKLLEVL